VRIGVDATCWANHRGYGRFTREVCSEMVRLAPDDEFVFFVDEKAAQVCDLDLPNLRLVVVDQSESPTDGAAADGHRSPLDMLRLTRAVWREPIDVFLSPTVYSYFPLPPGTPAVVTIHDAIPERLPHLTLPSRKARLFWKAKVKLALLQAKLVLTVSEYSRRELADVHHLSPDEIRVSHSCPSKIFRPSDTREEIEAMARRAGLPEGARWFIYVGGFNPHKNVDSIVRAHARLAAESDDPPHLLLVGRVSGDPFHGDQGRIRAEIERGGTENLVHWPGFIADDDLRHLHSGAIALLLPSQLEGLGLPAVEAAACATPVIAATTSPLPELLEGGGLFIDPDDEEGLYASMRRLFADDELNRAMGAKARERADDITWVKSALSALDALREAAA
jgi:glycosyltransferase involved in cell wall biosynthesis